MVWLAHWITVLIDAGGYAGIVLLMGMESACLPLPSELIMPFAGYLVSAGRFQLLLVALAGALGCNLGSAVAYWVGARLGRRFLLRYGRYALVGEAELDQAERFFTRFGAASVLIGRVLPLIRTFIALPAGIGRMKLLPFHLLTFGGSFVWCLVLAFIGEKLGTAWDHSPALHSAMHRLDGVVLLAVAALFGWFIWRHARRTAGPGVPPP